MPLPCHICFDVVRRQDGARTGDPEATNTLFKGVLSDSTAKQELGTGAVATTAVLSTADANFKALTGLLRLGRSIYVDAKFFDRFQLLQTPTYSHCVTQTAAEVISSPVTEPKANNVAFELHRYLTDPFQ
jgi:hypothetical protein